MSPELERIAASHQHQARIARLQVEDAIDAASGQWSRSLSLIIDLWVTVEEAS